MEFSPEGKRNHDECLRILRTRYFGYDCLGNTPHAITVEGVCISNIYEEPRTRYYNQTTRENGAVERGSDGELHFIPAENQ
jgi:hypothetical protein